MTKDEIKKALTCCAKSYGDDVHCSDCPYDTLTPRACCERFCQDVLCKDALKLITEQEKEIERLKAEKKQAQIDVLNKLKTKKYYVWGCGELLHITEYDIDELIAEVQNAENKS